MIQTEIEEENTNNHYTEEEENTNNHYERLLRFLDELFCNSHFPSLVDLSFQTNATNKFTLIAISSLLMDRNGSQRNELLSALVEFTLNPNKEIKLNGAASISCFLSSHSNNNPNTNIPQKILHSAQNGIDI
eukprot:214832_1